MRRAVVAVVLLLPLAAGCLAPPEELRAAATDAVPSTLRFDLNLSVQERLTFVAPDGVNLDVFAVRPDVAAAGAPDEKVPIIADVGPYFGNAGGDMGTLTAIDLRLAEYFVPRGYAVVRVSVRGTGDSGGCFDLGGPQEQKDVHDVVEWLAKQPWSNGAVALFGKSYDGTTPWEAAITKPDGLKTIVPISGITDMYRYTFYDGVAYPETLGFETYYPLLVDYDVDNGVPPTFYGQDRPASVVHTCPDLATQSVHGGRTILDGNHGTAFWKERDYEPLIPQVEVPVFLVHGLQDWNVKPDNGVPMYANITSPKAAWLGQWNHDYPDINRYNADWSRHDWNETLLVWFDHWLKGVDNDWETLAHVEYQDNLGTWRNATAWPPETAVEVPLWLTPAGGLATEPPQAATVTLQDLQGQGYDPEAKTGGLAYLTGPLASTVTLVGSPRLTVTLALDRFDGNLAVALYDVAPNGTWTEWDHGMRRMMHRETREQGSPVSPGETFTTTLTLYPQATTLEAGHRLAIALTPEMPAWMQAQPLGAGATYTIQLGENGARFDVLALDATQASVLRDAATADAATGTNAESGTLAIR